VLSDHPEEIEIVNSVEFVSGRLDCKAHVRGQTESCRSEPSSLSVLVRAAEVTGIG